MLDKGEAEVERCGSRTTSKEPLADSSSPQGNVPKGCNREDRFARFKHFTIDNGHLLFKGRVCVPFDGDFRAQTLKESHDSPSAGHSGIHRTYALVKR